jgi:valyl-tRNA synthetase
MSDNTPQNNPNTPELFKSPYNPEAHEATIYKLWEDSGYFNPDTLVEKGVVAADAKTFSIILPPPNANGRLHAAKCL